MVKLNVGSKVRCTAEMDLSEAYSCLLLPLLPFACVKPPTLPRVSAFLCHLLCCLVAPFATELTSAFICLLYGAAVQGGSSVL
jgi:hypothetical protein